MSSTSVILVFLTGFSVFLQPIEGHQNSRTLTQQSYNQEPTLISTYFSPSNTNSQSSSTSLNTQKSQQQSLAHYLTYPSPSPFYHQNVYLSSPGSTSQSHPNAGLSSSYSYTGFGSPGATNLYTYGQQASQTMMTSGSSSQPVMTAVPAPLGLGQEKLPSGNEQTTSSQQLSGGTTDKSSSKSPMGIVFGRPLSGYDGNFYVPVFYPLAWLGANSAAAISSSSDPMNAYPSTTSISSMPAPYGSYHHQHPRSHLVAPMHILHNSQSFLPNNHHPTHIFSYPSPAYHHHPSSSVSSQITSANLPKSTITSSSTSNNHPLYRLMIPINHAHSPSAIASFRSSPYQMIGSGNSGNSVGQMKPLSVDEMMPGDVTPDINGNYKRSSAQGAFHSHFHPHLQGQVPLENNDDANSYYFGDPTSLMRGNYDQQEGGSSSSNSMATAESSTSPQSYYYIAPMIKYRDPKDDYNLAMEASKEQLSAQKRFEKEVLMDDGYDDMTPTGSSESFLTAEEQSNNQVDKSGYSSSSPSPSQYLNPRQDVSPFNSSTDFAKIESRSSTDTQSTTTPTEPNRKSTAPKTPSSPHEPPVMTSIEIYDLPGANKYLGLDHSSSNDNIGGNPPFAQIARPSMLLQNQTEPTKLSSRGSALPASKFYRRKLSTASATESKTVK